MLSVTARALLLFALLLLLHHLLLFERHVHVTTRNHHTTLPRPARAALVTLADRSFARCAVSLLTNARTVGRWRYPIILLAIDHAIFRPEDVAALDALGVIVLHTQPVLDGWLHRGVENVDILRTLQKDKFRKMELFLNPILRAYDRLVYVDADGVIAANLEPIVHTRFPDNVTVLMRQNDVSVRKASLWGNEMAVEMLTDRQMKQLASQYPNRLKSGGSCWFVVDVRKLPSPAQILERSLELLCSFRAGFRLNDQTLLNFLFYDSVALFPWCIWDEMPVMNKPKALHSYCTENMRLQRRLTGDYRFMYRHMSVVEKKQCVLSEEEIEDVHIASSQETVEVGNVQVQEHQVDQDADCRTALRLWRRRLPVG